MNLSKVLAALLICLSLITPGAEGGIGILLLLKALALKGAAFTLLGIPLALGSFLLGQGAGFFGGSLFGGLGALKLTVKYLNNRVKHAYYKGLHGHGHGHGHYYHYNPYPLHDWFSKHFHGQLDTLPSIWNKVSSSPGNLTNSWSNNKRKPAAKNKNTSGWNAKRNLGTKDNHKQHFFGHSESEFKPSPSDVRMSFPYKGYLSNFDGQRESSGHVLKTIPAPNLLLEEFLENKLGQKMLMEKSDSKKKDAAQLIQMLREVYIKELANSFNTSMTEDEQNRRSIDAMSSIPAFKPIPSEPINSTTEKDTISEPSSTISLVLAPPPEKYNYNSYPNFESNFESLIPWRTSFNLDKRMGNAEEPALESTPNDLTNKQQQQPMAEPVISSSLALTTFADDMKKFFLLVSLFDYDECLRKVVCEVHTKGPEAILTTYESNIILTFQLMNAIIPLDVEDSTINFRKAAKIGELSKSAQICAKAYPSCSYSTDQIIRMGSQAGAEAVVAEMTNHMLPEGTSNDMESAASEDTNHIVDKVSSTVTAMPRV